MATLTSTDVEALFAGLVQAWNEGNPDGIADCFAPDGRLITPFGDEHDGQDAVRQAYRQYFGTVLAGTRTEVRGIRVRDMGSDLYLVDATQPLSGPFGDLHLTAVVRQQGEQAQFLEVRPYAFLQRP